MSVKDKDFWLDRIQREEVSDMWKEPEEWPEPEEITTSLLPVDKLPMTVIPDALKGWLVDIAYRMQCPIEFVAVAAMVVTSAIIGAGCGIKPKQKDDWLVVPNLWGGVIARSGMLKTPALMDVLKPLAILELEAKEQYEADINMFAAEREAYKAQKEALRGVMLQIAKGINKQGIHLPSMEEVKQRYADLKEIPEPARRRFKTNDTTIEKLGELLKENPRGVLVFRDELIGLLCSWDREDRRQDRAFYLEAWNGRGSFTTDRVGRGTIDIPNCCVSILGGIQPSRLTGYLQQIGKDIMNDGMLQRFQLLVYPDEPLKWELVDKYPNKEGKRIAYDALKKLAEMDFVLAGAIKEEGEIPYFRFTPEGQDFFYAWWKELEYKIRNEENPVLVEHLAKFRSLMPSLSLDTHLLNIAGGEEKPGAVTEGAAQKAAGWCEVLESHARRTYGLQGNIHQKAAEALAEKIKAGKLQDGFTVSEIYNRKQWHLLKEKEVVQEAIEELIEAGWLRQINIPIPGSKPKTCFNINPKIFGKNI